MKSIGETDETLGALIVSVFLLGFAVAPLIQAPLSEMYGRKPVLSIGNAIFVAFSIGAGFCNTVRRTACSGRGVLTDATRLPSWCCAAFSAAVVEQQHRQSLVVFWPISGI